MVRAGWRLVILHGVNTWHFHYSAGGIRSDKDQQILFQDEQRFQNFLQRWGVKTNNFKLIFLDSGRGDHYAFKTILPELFEKYKGVKIIIAACWHDCFWDIKNDDMLLCSLSDAAPIVDPAQHNIYGFMDKNKWTQSLTEAYRKMYL